MVDFLLTVEASIARGTLAVVATVWVVGTAPAVEARPVCARHGAQLTVLAIVTRGAGTTIRVFHVLMNTGRSVHLTLCTLFMDLNRHQTLPKAI